MQEYIIVTGIILKQSPVGEYDRHISLLTRERGKISAFARGARRPGNKLAAAATPFSFGKFKLYEGRNSYTLAEAEIQNYFEELRTDYEGACYGMYFAEVTDYYTRENNDEKELLKLLYQSLRALMHEGLSNVLVRYVFEMKAMVINGEFPGMPREGDWEESTRYAVSYIVDSSIERLYTFTVTPRVLMQLKQIADDYRVRYVDRQFKSLEIVDNL